MEVNTETRKYELTYWINGNVPEKNLDGILAEIKSLVEKLNGKIIKERSIVKENFSYPIKHFLSGFLGVNLIEIPPAKIDELRRSLKLNNNILRYAFGRAENIEEQVKKLEIAPLIRKRIPIQPPPISEEAKIHPPAPPKKEEKKEIKLEDVDKKLEEILGRGLKT